VFCFFGENMLNQLHVFQLQRGRSPEIQPMQEEVAQEVLAVYNGGFLLLCVLGGAGLVFLW